MHGARLLVVGAGGSICFFSPPKYNTVPPKSRTTYVEHVFDENGLNGLLLFAGKCDREAGGTRPLLPLHLEVRSARIRIICVFAPVVGHPLTANLYAREK